MEYVFAAGCDMKVDLPTTSELRSAIASCEKARKDGNPNSITEFICPQGDFFTDNNQSINQDTLPYIISVTLSFNKVDKEIYKYMQELQKKRYADSTIWITEIRACTDNIADIYNNICQFGTLESIINGTDPTKSIINRTNTYPQELCQNRAKSKTQWWYYLETILMADGISKNQKNSTDKWVTEVKWAYGRVLWSWHGYQKILARAVSKMTWYTKESN
jgi:hypothetical protein